MEKIIVVHWTKDPFFLSLSVPYDAITFDKCLCKGMYGEIYLGTFGTRQVAIKCLYPQKQKNTKETSFFLDEIVIMSSLKHPNIINFLGISWKGQDSSNLCAMIEFLNCCGKVIIFIICES